MTELPLADLLANPLVDPEAHLDWQQVARYESELEQAPPVVVFETEEGLLLLADGYHRVTAARRRGLATIKAELRPGTRRDALRYAAEAGARQRGIPVEAALAAIDRHSRR
jgi:ParB-like chromosome segregation protein Spo0J